MRHVFVNVFLKEEEELHITVAQNPKTTPVIFVIPFGHDAKLIFKRLITVFLLLTAEQPEEEAFAACEAFSG